MQVNLIQILTLTKNYQLLTAAPDHLLTRAIAGESGEGIVGGAPAANPRLGNLN